MHIYKFAGLCLRFSFGFGAGFGGFLKTSVGFALAAAPLLRLFLLHQVFHSFRIVDCIVSNLRDGALLSNFIEYHRVFICRNFLLYEALFKYSTGLWHRRSIFSLSAAQLRGAMLRE
ncbi:hypothetical protein HBH98_006710 [Parastagonospora nodorum]|nr:hypothetical protein HBH49_029170 [Parastagonospora nodorum]KAH4132939.1 hypothetical protein HBH47_004770 [Parastagonospora nodorum]KAH4271156.1 hypothetical protein HBI03_031940 [Parastagonospora nodorum]KAH4282083.1 hypothetical protein HBI04_026790 [Parastagonospora nodorum]KAH4353518.1 hypothetical protein HBH98_006710 [Parastagonospora nodorum]